MRDETLVKLVAIVALVILEVVNMFTLGYDGNVLLTIGAIIGGIAGYEIGRKGESIKEVLAKAVKKR
ncbi:MAG: hypothetical protein QW794_05095 [Thermosphaera sp.]